MDWHHRTPDGRWVWECAHSHLPHGTRLSGLFPHLHSLWASFFHDCETDLTSFSDIAAAAHLEYVGQPRPGVAAWRFPPHSLATNTLALLLKIFITPAVLIEGFGAGCSFAAVAGLLTMDHTCYPNTRRSSVLLSLGGVAMHPPTFSSLVDAYAFHHSQDAQKYHAYIHEERPDLSTRPADFQPAEKRELTYGFLIAQHVHDRKAPWTLSPLLLSHLQNKGISVLTLHDDVEAQREKVAKMDQDLVLTSPFGHYRHLYEDVMPTLKTFGATTFFTNFLRPLTCDQLEAREGAVGTTYSFDLPDLLLAFLSFHGTLPRPFFQAGSFGTSPRARLLPPSGPTAWPFPQNFMNVLWIFTRGLSSYLSAFLLFSPWASHSRTFMPWKQPSVKPSCAFLLPKHWTFSTLSSYLPSAPPLRAGQ